MFVKWTFILFGVATLVVFALGKVLAFLNPPRPGRPRPPMVRRMERSAGWLLLIPFALAVVMLVIALSTAP